jgi:hypothetical protein
MADVRRVRNQARRVARQAQEKRVKETLELMAEMRGTLMQQLATAAVDSFAAWHLGELLQSIDAAVARFREDYADVLQDGQRDAITHGQALIDAPLAAMEVAFLAPDVTEALLMTLRDSTLNLVTRISDNMRRDLAQQVQLGTIGVKDPYSVMQEVSRLLKTEGATGPQGYAARAEAITRTEIGRAQSLATQTRLEEAEARVPGLMKEWRHSGRRNPRPAHVVANGTRKPVREPFVINGVRLMYPRDPAAPASETVNCRCALLPYIP